MIRRDYFMRLVQQLADALARVVFLKKTGRNEQALKEIEQTWQGVFGLSGEVALKLSVNELIALCDGAADPLAEKCVLLADLLKEQGDLYALQDRIPDGRECHARALGLYLEAFTNRNCIVSADALARVEQLIDQTRGFRLPGEVFKQLMKYFELRARYASAENGLFDWLDSGEHGAAEEGVRFYERLMRKDDEQLAAGGLPRNEVEEGQKEFLDRLNRTSPN